MWSEIFVPQAPLIETIVRSACAYVVVLIVIRLIGRRGLAEMSTFDIIVAFLLADIIGTVAMADDSSLTAGAAAALTLVALNVGLNFLVHRSGVAARLVQGKPITVIRDGEFVEGGLRRLRISPREMDHAVRSQNGDDISEVDHGELTPSGKIVVTLKYEEQSATKADVADLTAQLRELRSLITGDR